MLLESLGAALLQKRLQMDIFGFPAYDERHLGEVLSILETGSRPKGGVVPGEFGMASLGGENIQSAGVSSAAQFKRVSVEFAAGMTRGLLEDEDVLVYKDGGKPGNFTPHVSAFGYGFPVKEATINEHVYRVRASGGISQSLLYWILRSQWMDHEMRKRGTGVAIPGLNSSNFRDLPLPLISSFDVEELNKALNPMLVFLLRLGAENAKISALRDTLLPELLSGRIRVPEGQEVVA